MNEELQKYISAEEVDPASIAARKDDDGFLALYRSLNLRNVLSDENLVRGSVDNGVIPEAVRYGVMRRGKMEVFRGVVKSTSGDFFYFNWSPDTDALKLVKADDETKHWEAEKLFKSCKFGCDLLKSEAPLDSGESVEESSEEEDDKGVVGQLAAQAPVSEDQNIESQRRLTTDVHPGSTTGATPDDENSGMDWHGEEDVNRATVVTRPGDGAPLAKTLDNWSSIDLLKAWGRNMQRMAPTLVPAAAPLEARYMTEVMGFTEADIRKGQTIPPRHRMGFQQWKAEQLRGRLGGLESFLKGHQ